MHKLVLGRVSEVRGFRVWMSTIHENSLSFFSEYFIYANAAKDHEDDQAAIMVSPLISDMPDFCFHFYFQIKVLLFKKSKYGH